MEDLGVSGDGRDGNGVSLVKGPRGIEFYVGQ